jgi:hypothetical protein
MRTEGDADVFMIRQAYALRECDLKRAGLEALIDASRPKQKSWWPW